MGGGLHGKVTSKNPGDVFRFYDTYGGRKVPGWNTAGNREESKGCGVGIWGDFLNFGKFFFFF